MKPRILLIPNESWWIIGEMGREIISILGDEFDFFFWPERLTARRPDLFRFLLEHSGAVHALNESSVPLILNAGACRTPPILSWIHHITSWSPEHEAAAQHSRAIIACTPQWAAEIQTAARRPVRTEVILHGINPEKFKPLPPQRTRFGIPEGVLSIGFSANHRSNYDGDRKGIPVMLAVLERLHAQRVPFHLSITGTGWKEEAQHLRSRGIQAHDLGFLPAHDIPLFYSTIDAFLMTSSVEGGPVTVLESMACGTPAVATRVGLVPDVIEDGVTGFSTEIGAVEDLASALQALAASPESARQIGQTARTFIAERRTWRVTLQPLRLLYREAIQAAPRLPALPSPPHWLRNPLHFLAAASVADPLLLKFSHFRRGESTFFQAYSEFRRMTAGSSLSDLSRGAGLLAGSHFRVPPSQESPADA